MAIPMIMQWLIGTWFVISTDAPIWLKGDKTAPTTTYTLMEHKGEQMLLDETGYTKKEKRKKIVGYDRAMPGCAGGFNWRGKGWLSIARSKWQVRHRDTAGQWAVIAYSKTIFTPAGVDIISRKPTLDAATLTYIYSQMMKDSLVAEHVVKMKAVGQKQ